MTTAAAPAKFAAVSILLNRAEGLFAECGPVMLETWHDSTPWARANAMLLAWSHTAPKGGGYNKCDFTITYASGDTYEGRFDICHLSHGAPDLAEHVRREVEFYTGDHCPAHMSAADYARVRAYSGHTPEEFRAYLATYEIG